ncbi:unnamed protein product [Effrenium voratum]|nr:unnamed protein product [Effrenium voratum]
MESAVAAALVGKVRLPVTSFGARYQAQATSPAAGAFPRPAFAAAAAAAFARRARGRARSRGDGGAAESRCYEVVPISGKGAGAVALRDLCPGELVAEEAPALQWSGAEDEEELQLAAADLSEEQRRRLLDLEDTFAESEADKTLLGIASTNAFQAGEQEGYEERDSRVLYLELSRFNHSCRPNCEGSWDSREGRLQIYACRDIPAGEELCIYYVDVRMPTAERQERMRSFGFQCSCTACQAADPISDQRRARMQLLLAHDSEEDEEALHVANFRKVAAYQAYTLSMSLGRMADAENWAQRAYQYSLQCHGPFHATTKILRHHASRKRA